MTQLQRGDKAPDFSLEDAEGKRWDLADLRGRKVIVYFYPADDTPGCTTQACDFRDAQTDLQKAGYRVFGVSPQGAVSHRRFSERYSLNFPLLVDSDLSMAKAYGVVDDRGHEYEGKKLKVRRSTFVIDEDGTLLEAQYGVRAKGHVDSLMSAVAPG
ncbi:MAG: peroxiredoxin [Actinomycetota bacterium]|nr:peroxiredoxin [Actinomycetota bacterium]